MRVGILGRTQMLYEAVPRLLEAGHQAVFILTGKAEKEYSKDENDFKKLAKNLSIPFRLTENLHSPGILEFIKKNRPDIGISLNWKTMIGGEILDCFPAGIINAHFGDLPRYRGNAVPNWAILNGEDRIVITLHKMDTELDSGPILLKRPLPLTEDTYIGDIYEALNREVPGLFAEVLNGIGGGRIRPQPQPSDPSLALRCFPRLPRDGAISWEAPAVRIHRLVRASAEPFAGAYTYIEDEKLIIWRSHPQKPENPCLGIPGSIAWRRPDLGQVAVVTGDGFLVLEEVETSKAGRGRAADLLKSLRIRLGLDTAAEIQRLREQIRLLQNKIKKNTAARGKRRRHAQARD